MTDHHALLDRLEPAMRTSEGWCRGVERDGCVKFSDFIEVGTRIPIHPPPHRRWH